MKVKKNDTVLVLTGKDAGKTGKVIASIPADNKIKVDGVGWKVAQTGKDLTLSVGFSHPVVVKAKDGITLTAVSPTEISVKGIDKVSVGQVAANIRAIRTPEPYHGYGIAYKGEVIERKEGKTAGK